MSNNPGKKGKPAPWVKRQESGFVAALYVYIREHHPEFAEWCDRRDQHRLKEHPSSSREFAAYAAAGALYVAVQIRLLPADCRRLAGSLVSTASG
jgi:hypothetical protein